MAAVLAVLVAAPVALAQSERGGKQVVESTCAGCHAKGVQGAPRIGDKKAWGARSAQGLRGLTQSALKGIRAMPAHGGDAQLTDLEIARAIAYMVNRSGGKWTEPASLQQLAAERSGPQVVREQCAQCHQKGTGGAPKIGDMAAWTPRLKQGLDNAVRSAIRGHGGMPPRGNRADLTDGEVRNAVLTMITPPAAAAQKQGAPAPTPAPSTLYRSVGGIDVHLGLVPAETMRRFPEGSPERTMHGGVPGGGGYYHVNVSLVDAASKAPIGDAKVEVRLELPGASGASSTLQPLAINNASGYGNYMRMLPRSAYRIVVRVQKPGAAAPVEARFEHRTR
jgi:cytochrome c5